MAHPVVRAGKGGKKVQPEEQGKIRIWEGDTHRHIRLGGWGTGAEKRGG